METKEDVKEITINLSEMFEGADFLGSRYDGEQVRELEDKLIKYGYKVVLNFEGIKCITQSFGDEVAGIYARAFGVDFVKQNIRAINMNETVKLILNASIKLSVKYGQKVTKKKEDNNGNNN
jgi:hypothetical protein